MSEFIFFRKQQKKIKNKKNYRKIDGASRTVRLTVNSVNSMTPRRRLRWLWKLETEAPIDCWRCGSRLGSDAWEGGGYEGKTLLCTYLHVGPNRIAPHMSASFTNPSAPIPHPAHRWERAMHGRMERQDPSVSSLTRRSHPRRVPHVSDLHTPHSRFHFAASLPARPPRIRL